MLVIEQSTGLVRVMRTGKRGARQVAELVLDGPRSPVELAALVELLAERLGWNGDAPAPAVEPAPATPAPRARRAPKPPARRGRASRDTIAAARARILELLAGGAELDVAELADGLAGMVHATTVLRLVRRMRDDGELVRHATSPYTWSAA